MDSEIKYNILYYGRHKYYQTMQNCALEGSKKYPNDISFRLFSGFSLVLSGRYQEGIRELDNLHSVRDVNIGAIVALIFAHRSCQTVDKEAVLMLDEKLKAERKSTTGMGLYFAALFLFLQQKVEKARDYLERFLKQNGESPEGLCLKGWIELMSDKSTKSKTASSCFKIVLEKDKKNLDASLGLVKVKELDRSYDEALALLNQVIVKNNTSILPLIEKMKLQLSTRDWEQALETSNRILTIDNNAIEAHRMKTLVIICREGNFNEGAINLKKLMAEIEKSESKNAKIFMDVAHLFASVCCRNSLILQETLRFAERAAQLEPGNADFLAELGYQHLMQGKLKEATRCFKNTTKLDDSSITGLTGLTLCQILSGGVNEQVKQQVEFLREIQSDDPSAELLFMSAMLSISPLDAAMALRQAVQVQLAKVRDVPYGIAYIRDINIDFLMKAVKENMKWALKAQFSDSVELYKNCLVVLDKIRKACPGLLEPQFEMARVHFLMGNLTEAKDVLTHVLGEFSTISTHASR